MFESDLVEHIHADFITGSPVPADTGDVGIREFPRGTMKVLVTEVQVDVDTRDPTGGENIIYRIRDVQETFFLYPDSLEIVEGVPAWKIFEWRERRFGPVPTISVTWGLVKANYE